MVIVRAAKKLLDRLGPATSAAKQASTTLSRNQLPQFRVASMGRCCQLC
jgi:hypothetical protein